MRDDPAMSGRYGFDPSWPDEQRRLALLERCYDPATTSLLADLGVGPGWRCLEVAAGNGSVARWLRDHVGPDGRVVAVDLDTRFIDDEEGIEVRRADVLIDDLPTDAFDLVHCRALLHHLPGRQLAALQRMASAVRPGGLLVTEEPYFGTMLASRTPAWPAAWRAYYEAMPDADYDWAPALATAAQDAGLIQVEARGLAEVVRGGSDHAELLRLSLEAVRPRVRAGADLDAGIALLGDRATLEPGMVWYAAWGRRAPA
jgi:SAM-dependent methyltransferase